MRVWKSRTDELAEAGGRLIVLSADHPEQLKAAVTKNTLLGLDYVSVDPSLWDAYGIRNPKRPKIPFPTTLVVAPDGTVVYRSSHLRARGRAKPREVIAALTAHRESGAIGKPDDTHEVREPDFDNAVDVTASRADGQLVVQVDVARGYHVYGAKETTSIPLEVSVPGVRTRAKIPPGTRKDLSLGSSWVLDGRIAIPVKAPADVEAGELRYQVCTDSVCSPPTTTPWTVP